MILKLLDRQSTELQALRTEHNIAIERLMQKHDRELNVLSGGQGGPTDPLQGMHQGTTLKLGLHNVPGQQGQPQTATTSRNRRIFRFQDLPAEIRNRIYAIVLSAPFAILLGRSKRKQRLTNRYGDSNKYKLYARLMCDPNSDARLSTALRCPLFPHHGLAILLLSRHIYEEAFPVLYGNNHFRFEVDAYRNQFFEEIGCGLHYVRFIQIANSYYCNLAISLRYLARAEKLSLLTFDAIPSYHFQSMDDLVKHLKQLFQRLAAPYVDRDARRKRFGVIKLSCNAETVEKLNETAGDQDAQIGSAQEAEAAIVTLAEKQLVAEGFL